MLLSKVKKSIELKTKRDIKLPDDNMLQEYIQEATINIANRCDPSELQRETITNEPILKMIEGGKVIVIPEYPDFTNTEMHLMIDEILTYPVINYVCFLITDNPNFKALADEDIAIYRCDYSRVLYGEE